nr:MAG TPA: DNA packaging protein [Caudoviricetes sp.]
MSTRIRKCTLNTRFSEASECFSEERCDVVLKVAEDAKKITVSQSNLARAIGVTSGRVSQLIQEGIVVRDDRDARGGVYLVQSIRNYDALKIGRNYGDDGDLDYISEKAKHERVKREIAELRLAKMERRAYDARTVELVLTEMLSNLRTQLLGLPSKLAPQLEGKTRDQIYEVMTRELEERLSELSEYTPELFTEEEVESDDEGGD